MAISTSTEQLSTTIKIQNNNDKIIAETTFVVAIAVIPINCVLIGALCRASVRKSPFSYLFVNVAVFDIMYLLTRMAWTYMNYATTAGSMCLGFDAFMRIIEKATEFMSTYTTAIIGILRALVVWKSSTKNEMELTRKTIFSILLGVWSSGIIGPAILILAFSCGSSRKCANSETPMYGTTELIHALTQIVIVNGSLIVSYGYICLMLRRHSQLMKATGFNEASQSHVRTIILLVGYVIVYSAFTMPLHIYLLFYATCYSTSAGKNNTIMFNVFAAIFPIGACGCNPIFLYALSGVIRRSVSVMISPLRSCSTAPIRA